MSNEQRSGLLLPHAHPQHHRHHLHNPANPHQRLPPALESTNGHSRRMSRRPRRPPHALPRMHNNHARQLHSHHRAFRQLQNNWDQRRRHSRDPVLVHLPRGLQHRLHAADPRVPGGDLDVFARVKGVAISAIANYLALLFHRFINPIAFEAISWKYYFVFLVILLVILVTIYTTNPETHGHSLEEIAVIFDGESAHITPRAAKMGVEKERMGKIEHAENA